MPGGKSFIIEKSSARLPQTLREFWRRRDGCCRRVVSVHDSPPEGRRTALCVRNIDAATRRRGLRHPVAKVQTLGNMRPTSPLGSVFKASATAAQECFHLSSTLSGRPDSETPNL